MTRARGGPTPMSTMEEGQEDRARVDRADLIARLTGLREQMSTAMQGGLTLVPERSAVVLLDAAITALRAPAPSLLNLNQEDGNLLDRCVTVAYLEDEITQDESTYLTRLLTLLEPDDPRQEPTP